MKGYESGSVGAAAKSADGDCGKLRMVNLLVRRPRFFMLPGLRKKKEKEIKIYFCCTWLLSGKQDWAEEREGRVTGSLRSDLFCIKTRPDFCAHKSRQKAPGVFPWTPEHF